MRSSMRFRYYLMIILLLALSSITQAKPLKLLLDWHLNPDHAPIIVAKEFGFFKKHHVKVKLIQPSNSADPVKMVAAGQADIGITYQPGFMIAVSQGLPLVRFASLVNQPLNCLLTLKQFDIKNLKDLKGKTLAHDASGGNQIMLRTMLRHEGMSLKDVNTITVHFSEVQALLSHRVQGFTGAMRNLEPYEIKQHGQKPQVFIPQNYGYPAYDELIFITNRDKIDDPRLPRFVAALREATHYLKQHPHKTWQRFANQHPDLDTQLNHTVWFKSLQYFADKPGKLNKQRYKQFAKFLQKEKLIKQLPQLSHYAVEIAKS